MKNFWKFSKSKNRKILKSLFRSKNRFPLPLAYNKVDLNRFSGKNLNLKFFDFRTSNFFKNFLRACYVGLAPQHALAGCQRLHTRPPLFFFTFSKSSRKKKNLKQSKLSVPEGHCQIKIIANFADNKNAPDDRRNAGPEVKHLILKTWPSGGPLMTTRWSLFVHSLSLRAG